jgi:hypothetical protein
MNLTLEDILDETNADQFFSEKHQRLYSVAKWADILSWIMLVFFVLVLALNIFSSASQFNAQYASYAGTTFFKYIFATPAALVQYLANWLLSLFKGIVFFLVLRAVSMGLNMIIETDLNYRGEHMEEGNE